MNKQVVYYVGTEAEVAHHARPLVERFDVRISEPERVVELAKPGDLAIFFSEHLRRFRDTVRMLKQREVATLYAIDGILEWRNAWENRTDEPASPFTMRPVLSDRVACIGASQQRVLNAWGNAGRTEVVGLPRMDPLAQRKMRQPDQEFRVLVMSAKWPGFTPQQIENAEHALRDMKCWFDENKQVGARRVVPVWRLTAGLAEKLGVQNELQDLTGGEIAEVLGRVDAVVTMPSTVMLEAMLHGLPVALLDYNICPHYVASAWEIFGPQQVDPVVRQLAEPAPEKLSFQKLLLEDALANHGRATDRMTELVQGMLTVAQQAARQSKPLDLSQRLLPETESPCRPSGFDHGDLYPAFDEFGAKELTQLQVQLADTRRDLAQRDAEVDQLQSELAQAHAIFSQIQSHPIAGPVVRTRQKLIDWLERWRASRAAGQAENAANSKLESLP